MAATIEVCATEANAFMKYTNKSTRFGSYL